MIHLLLACIGGLGLSIGMAYLFDALASECFRLGEVCEPPLVRGSKPQ